MHTASLDDKIEATTSSYPNIQRVFSCLSKPLPTNTTAVPPILLPPVGRTCVTLMQGKNSKDSLSVPIHVPPIPIPRLLLHALRTDGVKHLRLVDEVTEPADVSPIPKMHCRPFICLKPDPYTMIGRLAHAGAREGCTKRARGRVML